MSKFVQIEDLYNFDSLAAPSYNSAGNQLLFVQTKLDPKQDDYVSEIKLLNLNTAHCQTLVANGALNIEPKWGPKDQGFYYLSNKDQLRQIYYYDFLLKKSRQITTEPTGILDFEVQNPADVLFYTTQHQKNDLTKAFTTTRLSYQINNFGLVADHDRFSKLWAYQVATEKKTYLAAVDYAFGGKKAFAISNDGRQLAFKSKIVQADDFDFVEELRLLTFAEKSVTVIEDQSLTRRFSAKGFFSDPCFSLDKRYLGFLGNTDSYTNAKLTKLYVYDFLQKKLITEFAQKDLEFADVGVTDFQQNNTNSILQWDQTAKSFVVVVSQAGKIGLYAANPATKKISKVSLAAEHIQDFAINQNSGALALVISRPDLPTSLFERKPDGKKTELKTKISQQSEDYVFAKYQAFTFKSPDGSRVPCFLVLPPFNSDEGKIPLVLDIHGGPHAMYGYTFQHEIQTFAAQKMAVLLVNPRGSFGYGQEFASSVVGNYGKIDYQDLMTALDEILKRFSVIDAKQLFVTGGSYGGFMTNWITSHTNRFKRAATQRSISNFISLSGTSDIGYWFDALEINHSGIFQPKKLWEKSPLAYVKQVQTPTLILHSDQDRRCPLEQGQQWYTALKIQGVATKFVEFFGESHELSRTGKPSNRCRRLEELVNCFKDEYYFVNIT